MRYIVNTAFLNMRGQPEVANNIITALPEGHRIELKEKTSDFWWNISTIVAGVPLNGYVAAKFLIKDSLYTPPAIINSIKAIHREENRTNVTRNSRDSGWSYPIGEMNRPTRNGNVSIDKADSLTTIVNWLQVETSKRYQPTSNSTYCNIYAHDYCYLAGTYLPRVWWKSNALADLALGKQVLPRYDQTYMEMNANSLFDWLVDFGEQFGWKRTFDLVKLQEKANEGNVCLISAKNRILRRSGHISAVVPETSQQRAHRSNSHFSPLISQAGRHNYLYKTKYDWWQFNSFSHFGFWVHE